MSDLIKREDLFELMMRHKPIDNGDGSKEHYAYIEWLGIYHAIRELPSADRPQGEWIDKGKNLWKCSNCEMVIYSESEQDRNEFHKWCSRCGCRMKGADDE